MKSLAIVAALAALQSSSALHLNRERTKAESTVDIETVPPRTPLDAGCTKKAVDQLKTLYEELKEQGRGVDNLTKYNFGVKFLHACQRMDMYYEEVVGNDSERPLYLEFVNMLNYCTQKEKPDTQDDETFLGIPETYAIEDFQVSDLGDAEEKDANLKLCLESINHLHGKHNKEVVERLLENFESRCGSVETSPEEYEDEVLLTGAITPDEFMQWAPEAFTDCVDPPKYPKKEPKEANKNPYNVAIPTDRCCKICEKGYACRNSCISTDSECQYRLDFQKTDEKKAMMSVNLPGCACDLNFTCKRGATPEEQMDDPLAPPKKEEEEEEKTPSPEKEEEEDKTPKDDEKKPPTADDDQAPPPPTEDKPIKPHDEGETPTEPTEPKKTEDNPDTPPSTEDDDKKPQEGEQTETGGTGEGTSTPPSKTPNGGDPKKEKKKSGFCFPSTALFTREDGSQIPADRLQIGDRILVISEQDHEPSFEPVVFFAVKQPNAVSSMRKLTLSSGQILSLTSTHFVNVRKGNTGPETLVRSQHVEVGDGMWVAASDGTRRITATVVKTETVREARGLFAPVPLKASRMIVDGVEASAWGAFVSFNLFHETLAPSVYAFLRTAILHPLYALANALEGPGLMARGVAIIWGDGSAVMSADAVLSSEWGQWCAQVTVFALFALFWVSRVGKKKQAAEAVFEFITGN